MSNWDSKYKWDFPLAGSSDDVGFNDAGIGMFKSQPYPSLAKEIIQNVLDARGEKVSESEPVKVKFSRIEIDRDDIPGGDELAEAIDNCCKYYKTGDNHEKMMKVKEYSDQHLKKWGKIPVLKISDFNTTGLTGVNNPDDQKSCWYGLVKSFSSTNKSDGSSGSQGVGKFATYNFTELRTVLYSTRTEDNEIGFQGKTILVTFRDGENRKRVNKARFGKPISEDVLPITEKDDIPEIFRRNEPGTDIYVIGFEPDDDNWVKLMAMSVIECFFYAIYKRTLEVDLEDADQIIHIDKNNIGEKIAEYDEYYKKMDMREDDSFQYTAPLYWKAITETKNPIVKKFTYNRQSMGEYELYLLMGPDVQERRVLEMRKAGMKIREDTGFRIQSSFIGVFIATGNNASSMKPEDNISSFLRKCENPSHDKWSHENYPEEKKKAKGIIKHIHEIIKESVQEKTPKNNEKEIKAYGLNDLLMNQGTGDAEEDKEDAFVTAKPEPIDLLDYNVTGKKSKDLSRSSNGRGKNTTGKRKKKARNSGKHRNNRHGHEEGKVYPLSLGLLKTPYDSEKGLYRIVFSTDVDAVNLHLALNVIGDDGHNEKADITVAEMNGNTLNIKENCIIIPSVKTGTKNIIEVCLRGNRRERLEVSAYAKLQ